MENEGPDKNITTENTVRNHRVQSQHASLSTHTKTTPSVKKKVPP